ncbi:MAG: hypothetical protein KAS59_05065 [Alphaproteobacteria bacterium]|nr:hypothetical protein [Alphaproteobacteria bacterium]
MSTEHGDARDIVEQGLKKGDLVLAFQRVVEKGSITDKQELCDLRQTFENAAVLIEGLTILEDKPESKFIFSLTKSNKKPLEVSTNVLRKDGKQFNFSIKKDGSLEDDTGREITTTADKTLERIAQKAKVQRLIPLKN